MTRIPDLRAPSDKLNVVKQLDANIQRLYNAGRYAEAILEAERALAVRENMVGTEHPDVANALRNLALLYDTIRDHAKAVPLHQRALAIMGKRAAPPPTFVAVWLNSLAALYHSQGDYSKAESLYERAVEVSEKALGPEHSDVASMLNNLALCCAAKGDYAKAAFLHERALVILVRTLGSGNPQVAGALNNLAQLYQATGDYKKAEPLHRGALTIYESIFGPEHPNVAIALNNLGMFYTYMGDYAEAEPLFWQALAIHEKEWGPDHLNITADLNNLAALYRSKGNYAKARTLYQRALAIREEVLGPNHPDVATVLNNLADLYQRINNYTEAESLYQQALAVYENTFGATHPNVATGLNNLAGLYARKGDYAQAEPLYRRALTIYENALGPKHSNVAAAASNLALVYSSRGDYAKAEMLHRRALTIREEVLGPNHPEVATVLNNLALFYANKKRYNKAEPLYRQALAIREKTFGRKHYAVAASLNNLAGLYGDQGNYAEAERLCRQALIIRKQVFGEKHYAVAASLNNLAGLYRARGDYKKAERLYRKSLAIYEESFWPEHAYVSIALNNLASVYEATAEFPKALAFRVKASNISEHHINLNLAIGSEQQKLLYLAMFSEETDRVISLHACTAPNDPEALRFALTTILRRKGRVLDAMAESIGTLRRRLDPPLQALLDQLTEAQAGLAALMWEFGEPGKMDMAQYQAETRRLEEQIEEIEDQVSRQSAEFRATSPAVTLEAIQSTIPADAMLVEWVSFNPYNAKKKRWEPRCYAAYVLGNEGPPVWVMLGKAKIIDDAVKEFRAVLRKDMNKPLSNLESEVKPVACALDQLIMQPVRKLIGDKRQLLLSPDGALNLVPFAALVDDQGRYLIESYSIAYLTTGRDMLRLQMRMKNQQEVAVFANPNFEKARTTAPERIAKVKETGVNPVNRENAAASAGGARAIDFSRLFFNPLPGTASEARALKKLFPNANVWTRQQATKTALKQISAPAILHIATHGFFFDDAVVSAIEAQGRGLGAHANQPGELTGPVIRIADPMLRSGLAMAGANLHRSDNPGILTAKEASGLNLWGTRLVVLSACDTGIGEIKNGEGVYGLRRALVLAGSETQVMSLWSVSDDDTRALMVAYYKALKAGQGRSEALRKVQLKMLASSRRKHPYYWASFIQSGEWANLDGKR